VLEDVGETGTEIGSFGNGSGPDPRLERDDGRGMIFIDDESDAVGEFELLGWRERINVHGRRGSTRGGVEGG
jgi:hypothetical protein